MKETVLKKFEELYGGAGEARVYFAPGRVNMIGEHTDYNGGHVFPCALTIGTYAAVKKRTDRKLRFYSMNFENMGVTESSLDDLTPSDAADELSEGRYVGFCRARHEDGLRAGYCVKRQYSQWIGIIFLCIFGGADGILPSGSFWI